MVLEEEWRGAVLAYTVTLLEELFVLGWVVDGVVEIVAPLGGDAGEWRVETVAEGLDDHGEGVAVVLVFATSEAVFGHDDAAAELYGVVVACREFGALGRREEWTGSSVTSFGEAGLEFGPIEIGDFVL